MSVVKGVLDNVNSILGLRDELGAALKPVYIITRSWSGSELGDGDPTESRIQMLPSPRVVEFKHDVRLVEGGNVKAGDILLKQVSKQTYTHENQLDGSSCNQTTEMLYEVGGILYRVINVRERHVTWNVLLRRLSNPTRE